MSVWDDEEDVSYDDGEYDIFTFTKSGISLLHTEMLKKGSKVQLDVEGYQFDAKVVFSEKAAAGYHIDLAFKQMDDTQKSQLVSLISKFTRGAPLQYDIIEQDD